MQESCPDGWVDRTFAEPRDFVSARLRDPRLFARRRCPTTSVKDLSALRIFLFLTFLSSCVIQFSL